MSEIDEKTSEPKQEKKAIAFGTEESRFSVDVKVYEDGWTVDIDGNANTEFHETISSTASGWVAGERAALEYLIARLESIKFNLPDAKE